MKVNKAPEKIILSADKDTKIIYDEWVTEDLTDNIKIEYIRTDAFFDKAKSWFIQQHTGMWNEFKNYMKGE